MHVSGGQACASGGPLSRETDRAIKVHRLIGQPLPGRQQEVRHVDDVACPPRALFHLGGHIQRAHSDALTVAPTVAPTVENAPHRAARGALRCQQRGGGGEPAGAGQSSTPHLEVRLEHRASVEEALQEHLGSSDGDLRPVARVPSMRAAVAALLAGRFARGDSHAARARGAYSSRRMPACSMNSVAHMRRSYSSSGGTPSATDGGRASCSAVATAFSSANVGFVAAILQTL